MTHLNIDDYDNIDNRTCAVCGKPLTLTNISKWEVFVEGGKTAFQCLDCEWESLTTSPLKWSEEEQAYIFPFEDEE